MQMPSMSNPAAPSTAEPDPLARRRSPRSLSTSFWHLRALTIPRSRPRSAIAETPACKAGWPLAQPRPRLQGRDRGGSYGGGEQGAFLQQTIPLGGKLGRRRDIYQAQQRPVSSRSLRNSSASRAISKAPSTPRCSPAGDRYSLTAQRPCRRRCSNGAPARQRRPGRRARVLQSEVEQEQAALDILAARHRYIAAFHQLIALAGQPDLPLTHLAGDLTAAPAQPPSLDSILEQSPAVQRANQAVNAAEAQLRSARREVVPDLTLRAGEQWNNELIRQNPNVATGAQSFASASIDLPLWNRNQGNIAAAQSAVNASQAEALRVRLALRQSAAPLVEQYNIAAAQSSRYKSDLLPRAQRAYELYRDRYRQMAAAYPQVLVSQRTLFQLQLAYIQSLGELWQSSARLRHFTLNGALVSPENQ